MKHSAKRKLLLRNTLLWLVAMGVPVILSLGLAGTKFPWQILVSLLILGGMLASNRMFAQAIGPTTDDES